VPLLHLFSRTQPPTSPKSTTEITAFPHPVTSTAHHNHTHKRGRTFHTPLSPVSPSHTHTHTHTHNTYIILTPPLRSPHPSPSPQQSRKIPICRRAAPAGQRVGKIRTDVHMSDARNQRGNAAHCTAGSGRRYPALFFITLLCGGGMRHQVSGV
jgi:hypothetical protein